MKKVLIFAGAVTALAVTSAPAFAVPVPATTQANAHARIFRPLTITAVRDLNLGDIVLSGTGAYTDTVGITKAGVFSCGADVTCSNTHQTAQYTVTGTNQQTVVITVSPTIAMVNQTQTSPNLTLTVDSPATVALGASGNSGVTFDIGGSIQVSDTTADGVYQGTFDVSADYQ
jgi:hypothetical protein